MDAAMDLSGKTEADVKINRARVAARNSMNPTIRIPPLRPYQLIAQYKTARY
jgi:hypothetical protein